MRANGGTPNGVVQVSKNGFAAAGDGFCELSSHVRYVVLRFPEHNLAHSIPK